MTNFLFMHAHPDDEAIFNSGTIAHLAKNNNVHVMFATDGSLGSCEHCSASELAEIRKNEAKSSCNLLGVQNVEFLPYGDSGLVTKDAPENSFVKSDNNKVINELNTYIVDNKIEVIISYDKNGIYPHPDHLKVNSMCTELKRRNNSLLLFETTIDREHLHFVESHIVHHATLSTILDVTENIELDEKIKKAKQSIGFSTLDIDINNDISNFLTLKRKSMSEHKSQIPQDSPLLKLSDNDFKSVYGIEWFINKNIDKETSTLLKI